MPMAWLRWTIIALMALEGGWMLFDGARALILGDYVTPSSGPYAGQLGPWSNLARAIGIEPRSTLMKSIYAGQGLLALGTAVCFALRLPWAGWGMVAVAILGSWYLPIGTVIDVVVLLLLFLSR
jgi:hypothetical protein